MGAMSEVQHWKQDLARWYRNGGRNTSFILTKCFHYDDKTRIEHKLELLNRLKEEDFNRIKIPNFEWQVADDKLYIISEYIKGFHINLRQITYLEEDLVERNSEFSFNDYACRNFIREEGSEEVYAVDLDSYGEYPKWERRLMWQRVKNNFYEFV